MATEITANMVKELRERSGAGMMECKKALQEAQGNMKAAEEIVAKAGHKKAAKSASRTAAEGRIVIHSENSAIAMVEINCETDFVGRDESFVHFCQEVARKALSAQPKEVNELLTLPLADYSTIEDARKALIARLGENIQVRRLHCLKGQNGQRIGSYVHNARIGAVVVVEGGDDILAKDLAMHVAAMKPHYITPEQVPQATVAQQLELLNERAKQSGKPENIVEKMIAGQLQKHLNEICLTGQSFFKDPDQSIGTLLKKANAQVKEMLRLEVGEGIEVTKKSFEEEVMSQVKGS